MSIIWIILGGKQRTKHIIILLRVCFAMRHMLMMLQSSSSCSELATWFSSSSNNVVNRIRSDSFSLKRSFTWIRKLGIWNSTGMTASSRMLVGMGLSGCWFYTLSGTPKVRSAISYPNRFGSHWQSFARCFAEFYSLIPLIRWFAGSKGCSFCVLPRKMTSSFLLPVRESALLGH